MKTSLGIWALGPMVTDFLPGGYQPHGAGASAAQRVRLAVDGLGDLIDGTRRSWTKLNLGEVREALGAHDIYCLASGLHLDARQLREAQAAKDAVLAYVHAYGALRAE